MNDFLDNPPQGAVRQSDGSVVWRVWAPLCDGMTLVWRCGDQSHEARMRPEDRGYFSHREAAVEEGTRYAFRLADGKTYPDPASRWQPEGVHKFSAVFSPQRYGWHDTGWPGIARDALVIYELHVGTFTPEGTLAAIIPRLDGLRRLGITALEIMPVAQFPGRRNWGYDGVHAYAVQDSYGGPQGLQELVDMAHQVGLAVILDVVYNHFGPEGSYQGNFGPYFTDRYHTPWGSAINYDGTGSDAVRQFVVDNARMWVRDFHMDGLRLDAVQTIYDFSPRHILADIQTGVQEEAARARRRVHVIAESNQSDVRLLLPPEQGGYGLDAVWADDFHHSVHSLLTGQRHDYYLDFGQPAQLAKAYRDVFVYDGCYSPFFKRRQGTAVGALDRTRFVFCTQNHDQVGNQPAGERLTTLLPPEAQRLACGLLLMAPGTPLLFMGEEYGETRPFPFFCSFGDPELVEAVRRGRKAEMGSLAALGHADIPDPQSPQTFNEAKLNWQWPAGSPQAQRRQLYADLLALRRAWAVHDDRRTRSGRLLAGGSSDASAVLVLEGPADCGAVAVANLTAGPQPLKSLPDVAARIRLSTEDVAYGGQRRPDQPWTDLLPYEMLVLKRTKGPA